MVKSRQLGAEQLRLEVVEANQGAIRLYQKLGFEEEGRNRKTFRAKSGVYYDEIVMVYFYDKEK